MISIGKINISADLMSPLFFLLTFFTFFSHFFLTFFQLWDINLQTTPPPEKKLKQKKINLNSEVTIMRKSQNCTISKSELREFFSCNCEFPHKCWLFSEIVFCNFDIISKCSENLTLFLKKSLNLIILALRVKSNSEGTKYYFRTIGDFISLNNHFLSQHCDI